MEHCHVLTIGQRCADWFFMRQFRVTGTLAGRSIMSDNEVRQLLGLAVRSVEAPRPQQLPRQCAESWFSGSRSTEARMKGTANEKAAFLALEAKPFVKVVFEVGMVSRKEESWLACSADGIAIIDHKELGLEGFTESKALGGIIASVEIKTSVASSSLDRVIAIATADAIICEFGDATSRQYIPEIHMGQVIQQMLVLRVRLAVYVSSSETGILYVVVVRAPEYILNAFELALAPNTRALASWAHEFLAADLVPLSFADAQTEVLLQDKLSFWRAINEDIKEKRPMPPIKVFKHGIQSLYSKTKGGVDGTAQARAVMRSSTSSLRWEQKLVIQTLKTLAVNAFTSYRLQCKAHLLESRDAFGGMKRFRDFLNTVQSLADFIYDVSGELLQHADGLQVSSAVPDVMNAPAGNISKACLSRLSSLAKSRKRRRFF